MRHKIPFLHRRLLPPPLGLTLGIAVLLPFIAAMGLTGWFSIQLLEQHSRARMQKDIELIARAIRLPLSHALERGYDGTVDRALESAFRINRVYGVYVYDRDGETVYASGARAASMDTDRAARIARRGERQGEFAEAGEEEVFSYFVPLVDAGERINGLLQITRRGSDFDKVLGQLRRQSLSIAVLAGIALVLIILLGHRWALGRHLSAVETGLAKIRGGALQHRLAAAGPRELQRMVTAINGMLDAIARSNAELAAQQDREAELTEKLHQSEKLAALGQLSAGVAHELGSPLSTVDGKAQRLLRQENLPPAVAAALESIRRETTRMARIIHQLLDFGRSNPLDRRRVPAPQPLLSAVNRAERADCKHIRLEQRIAPQADKLRVNVDLVRLEQALGNLLRNALQAARTQVRVSCAVEADAIRYAFEDDGTGVNEQLRPHLFEPFFTTKPAGQGTGLGLAVAHAAARDHGGRIDVHSSALGGARFDLILPRESSDE